MKTAKVTMIDPPSGWMYGFPKALPQGFDTTNQSELAKWFIDQGYPIKDLSLALKYSHVWDENFPEI